MATDTRTAAPTQATDANFRLWVIAVDAALLAAGLTAASDTGQINTATVTRPTVASSIKGFKMYRFNDTLQASKPVFIKVEFGSGAAATNPTVYVTVGTATDGAGTLTGSTLTSTFSGMQSMTASTTARTMYAAGVAAEGWFTFALWPGLNDGISAGVNLCLIVERTRDSAGALTGDGLFVLGGSQGGATPYFLNFTTGAAPTISFLATPFQALGSGIVGADTYVYPVCPGGGYAFGRIWPPNISCVLYWHPDITRNTSISVSLYGTSHTYKCLGDWMTGVTYGAGSNVQTANSVLAMRWE